jgi:hypothetical protein
MEKVRFDEYIRRFNDQDLTAFDEFLAPDMHMRNGTLEFVGVQAMKDHYAKIWPTFREELFADRFVSDDEHLAIRMRALFTAHRDDETSIFGPVRAGETFEFNGVILYCLDTGERFTDILVAYNSFVFTDSGGGRHHLGIPH